MFGNIFNQNQKKDQADPNGQPTNTMTAAPDQQSSQTAAPGGAPQDTPTPPPSDQGAPNPYGGSPDGSQTPPPGQDTPMNANDQQTPSPDGTAQDPNAALQPDGQAPSQGTGAPDSTGGNNGQQVDMNALSHLDPRTAQTLTRSQEETRRIKQQNIEPEQLLLGLLYDEQIYNMLHDQGADGGQLTKEIQTDEKMGTYQGQPTLSKISQEVFDQAYRDSKMRGANFITPEDVLIVLFSPNYKTSQYLQKHNLKKETMVEKFSKNANTNYGKRTVLEKYGIDLTEEARAGKLDPIAGRDKEIDRMIHVLLRRTKNNPIIIGEPGVGKTAIVEGLAQKIVQGSVPKELQDKRIFQLDVASLVAGASHRGEFEERMRGVINEVLGSNNRIILFIDEIHALMGTGEEGMNAANIIKPHLARGHFQLIGATTTVEYRKNFEKDKAFERRFQPVTCEEPSEENAYEMLKIIRPKYEKFHNVSLPDDALKECVKLSKKYIGERYLPDKAIDLLDEACSEVKLQIAGGTRTSGEAAVKKADIEKVVSAWTGIPITKLTEDESAKLLKLEDRIHQRLVDQQEAVVAVSEAVRRGRIGLAAANRPIASFIFLGPTGVGKTELAKTLAELLFGRDDAMARLDMSEYMEKHEVAKLIGAPPGYVGYEEGGQLTEAVRKKPYSIVLMDEIEKAHPDVFNILLQLLEDGRLTDNKGNTISFKNTIVICTSNIGSTTIQQHLSQIDPKAKRSSEDMEKSFKELQGIVRDELTKFLRPEVLNRFDEVVIFKPLAPEHMAGIARLGIAKTAKLLKEQGYTLQITEHAIAQLAKDGYDPVYGARPLRRLIQTAIENPIALAIISKKFVPGDTIVIDYSDNTNEFFFTKSGGVADVAPMTDEQFRTFLVQLNNPENVSNVTDRQRYMEVHDLVQKGKVENNKTASSIMEVTAATDIAQIQTIRKELDIAKGKGDAMSQAILDLAASVAHQIQATIMLQHILLEIIHPDDIIQPAKKLRFMQLHNKVQEESQRQNALALKIMAVTENTPANAIDELMEELRTGSANGDDLATEILSAVNIEITEEAEAIHQASPLTKYKKVMQQLINPLYLADPEDKTKFTRVYDKITEANKEGNPIAASILSLTDITSDSDIEQLKGQLEQAKGHGDGLAKEILDVITEAIQKEPIRNLKKTLLLISNPVAIQDSQEREQYAQLKTKVSEASQKGNELATAALAVKETTTDDEMNHIMDELNNAKAKNDEIAMMIDALVGTVAAPATPPAAPAADQAPAAPSQNVQQPSPQVDVSTQAPSAPAPTGTTMPTPPQQNNSGLFTPPPPPAQSAFSAPAPSGVDSAPTGAAVGGNGSMMQPQQNAYNFSGIPASARPINYIAPQSRQEEIE
ncbi:MAG TPA: AAA family ATPase [Candidatus Saccharimonadales bacterium]|nr:AAA family ATPase [Candidatus Saccharimonadales bacterium]